ncbi:type II toxin-antitoxin system RelE/ParE family toxin [Nodosilinea sp. LEGE 06152]|uniref:type II toxin-antitoxin system RelE/ParE family toxin n=1 Tax=Nodosilinea sp. LEGE 06152 TaxID=2777966 RepID=UPI001882316D|nr:type II toxin-antitoxin system RelE/ParE family toxin [Nodosilinea sp. LEGE 06152]MBE9160366.1 type II toxin-antitoxin system RelE/ParE family toxin [Nodosilinea sp. LEGE 06152]
MTYRIDLSSVAKSDADAAFLSFAQYTTSNRAQEWYQGLIKAIATLETMPRRCPTARESAFFSQEIRQLLYGQGQRTYRILFTVLDDQPTPTVRILHIRNAAQRAIGEPDASDG